MAWLGKTTEALVTKLKVRLSLLLSKQSILRNGTAQPGFGPQQWKEASISTSPKVPLLTRWAHVSEYDSEAEGENDVR